MLYRETIAFYYDSHTKHGNSCPLFTERRIFETLYLVIHEVTAGPLRVKQQ